MLGVFSGFSGPPESDETAARFLKEAVSVADDEPPVRSMLGRLAEEAASIAPESEEDDDAGPATMLSLDGAVPAAPAEEGFGHLTQHSTIAELAGLEEHVANEWPIELRANGRSWSSGSGTPIPRESVTTETRRGFSPEVVPSRGGYGSSLKRALRGGRP